jgi:AcrR family transcriptional regulator
MSDGARRAEILDTAANLFASSGSRTSLKDVAAACGILPGSLYHHFDSKEAIIVELVQRYQADLDRVAQHALDTLHDDDHRPVDERVVELAEAIASCAVRHRAALLLTVYEPPAGASEELWRLVQETPHAIHEAMLAILGAGRAEGAVRADVDLALLSYRLWQSALRHGVGDSYLVPGADRSPEVRCRLVLEGLAASRASTVGLDDSDALGVARLLIDGWQDDVDGDDRVRRIRAVAREEFGRRGYEETTIRDVAAAAGMSIAAIYRCFRSKDELLASIMRPYMEKRAQAWDGVLASASSPLEQLDALAWVNIVVLDRYIDEYRIQLAWLRESPPSFHTFGSTAAQRRSIRALLTSGTKAGTIRFEHGSAEMRARCVYEALWVPEDIVRTAGTKAAHTLARQTLLEGALTR